MARPLLDALRTRAPHGRVLRARERARRAFTLVELMIALAVGGVAITSMYAIGAASTRQFQQQHQVASMQASLRLAMLQVKRDIQRAGFQASARADVAVDACAVPLASESVDAGGSGWIAGISSFRNDVAPSSGVDPVDPTGNNRANGFTTDEITLIGNYATGNEYPIVDVASASDVRVDAAPLTAFQSVRNDFMWDTAGLPSPGAVNLGRVRDAFPPGSLIRIQTSTNRRHFARLLTAPTFAGTQLSFTFDPALPSNCEEEARHGLLSPLSIVRYAAALSANNGVDTDRVTGAIGQLIRTEVQVGDKVTQLAPLTHPPRVVLDYLAAFNLAFTMNGFGLGNGQPDFYTVGQTTNVQATVNANPELIRAVTIELAVRAPSQDPSFPFTGCGGLRCFQIDASAGAGGPAARVRVLRSEVFLPNIAAEGL